MSLILPTRYTSDPDVLSNVEERRIVQSLWDNYFHQTVLALASNPAVAEVTKRREQGYDACRSLRPIHYLSDPEVLADPNLFAVVQLDWDTYFRRMRNVLQRFPYTEEERERMRPVEITEENDPHQTSDTESLSDPLVEEVD